MRLLGTVASSRIVDGLILAREESAARLADHSLFLSSSDAASLNERALFFSHSFLTISASMSTAPFWPSTSIRSIAPIVLSSPIFK